MHDINPGSNDFTWFFTMGHVTRSISYFMTVEGWDPNSPLTRDSLELIEQTEYNGRFFGANARHTTQVNIPQDRSGYHVILSVWDVGDTDAAFYQVIDVYVTTDEVELIPPPEGEHPELDCCESKDPEDPEITPEDPEIENLFDPTRVYWKGDIVFYQGNLYKANWWSLGESPSTSAAWSIIPVIHGNCLCRWKYCSP